MQHTQRFVRWDPWRTATHPLCAVGAASLEQLSHRRFSELTIREISRRCGFTNQEMFSRAFWKRLRATPRACRAGTAAR
jgi:AraC-like DNA-binding protein